MWPRRGALTGAEAPPGELQARYTGRMDWSDPAGPRFSNTGSAVAVRVEAPELLIQLRDTPYPQDDAGLREPNHYELLIDGASTAVLVPSGEDFRHTVALGEGEHVVELFKRTEPLVGRGQLLAVELPAGGRWLDPPERRSTASNSSATRLTTGYGNAGPGPDCDFSAATEDGYRSYAFIAARALQAEAHVVAWSGRGVLRNYDLTTAEAIPALYQRARPEDPQSAWDFSRWAPHAVVINAGTNDFSQVGLEISAFEQRYIELVTEVRRRSPDAFIFCAYPSITDDWPQGVRYGTRSREAMGRVMAALNGAGINRVQLFAWDPARAQDGIGCDYHPSLKTHEAMAAQLRGVISQALGW